MTRPSFSAERWSKISEMLDQVLTLPRDDRAAFLAAACPEDSLRRDIEELLIAGERDDHLLDTPAGALASRLIGAHAQYAPPSSGARVGPYRILGEIAHGGMGTVYLAERADEQYEKRVALKLVRGALHAEDYLTRRFVEERQILASLDHANIARLLDGGVTHEGMPWFAMELVRGQPIDQFASERQLGIEARLELFLAVCEGVAYAHRTLIIHRDLKPSNILVTDDGCVKLLDFGIAKLVAESARDEPATHSTFQALTPDYASPEQWSGAGVGVASDVYSLGVLLYELLAGRRPPRAEPRRADDSGAAAREAPPPSSVSPERARRQLRGDLDTIVLTALKLDPARRYPSVESLAADVRRYLTRMPISARPDTWSYRTGRFFRRHRVGVGAGAASAALLIAALAGFAWQAHIASREARQERELKNFTVGLFELSDPAASKGRAVTARELLDRGEHRIRTSLTADPEVRAEMLGILGSIYARLGIYDQASRLLAQSVDLRRRASGNRGPALAEGLGTLGRVLADRSDYPASERALREALALRADAGASDTTTLNVLTTLADVRRGTGRLPEADSLLRVVLARQTTALPATDPSIAATLSTLGVVARQRGDFVQAEARHRAALAIRRAHFGETDPSVAESMKNLALVLHSTGRFAEAESLYRRTLAVQRTLYGEKHPEIGSTLNSLASLLATTGKPAEAETMFQEALTMQRELLGPVHENIAATLDNYGSMLSRRGEYRRALPLEQESLDMRRRLFGATHPSVATALNNIARILMELGQDAAAERYYRQAHDQYVALLGPNHAFVGTALANLAMLELRERKYAAADSLYRQALRIYDVSLPPGHANRASVLTGLGETMLRRHRPADAEPLLRQAIDIDRKSGQQLNPRFIAAERLLGAALAELSRNAEAEQWLQASYEASRSADTPALHAERVATLEGLESFYRELGRRDDAARTSALLAQMR